jgi:hypothetical protein
MTIFGISGCTALLVIGFGIKDSINTIVDKQYGDLHTYNEVVAWVVFELEDPDNVKVTPVVTFSIEAGAEVAPGAPITYTVSNGLVGTAQFDKDEAFYCAYEGVAPTEPGTYALVVNVAETETTKALVTWVVFTVVA